MKKVLSIIVMALMVAVSASGQHKDNHKKSGKGHAVEQRDKDHHSKKGRKDHGKMDKHGGHDMHGNHDKHGKHDIHGGHDMHREHGKTYQFHGQKGGGHIHHDNGHIHHDKGYIQKDGHGIKGGHVGHAGHAGHVGHGHMHARVYCNRDWLDLWNGCHVRLLQGRVSIVDVHGDRIVRGDEVVLLASGMYLVRSGDIWRVYDQWGEYTSISGHEIIDWENGLFCVRYSDFWRVYTAAGNRLSNVWGDVVVLMHNNIIRCTRAGFDHFYNLYGDEVR